MSDCDNCGRDSGHWIGCKAAHSAKLPVFDPKANATAALAILTECGKDDCSNPKAQSKGPTPAKYCEDHKTGSKK